MPKNIQHGQARSRGVLKRIAWIIVGVAFWFATFYTFAFIYAL